MIFLHSSFRVSSTWLWSRFRRSNKVIAYCEVFNEVLATITRTQLNKVAYSAWHSKHPVDAGYFLEFLPLIKDEGGVDKFDPTMSFPHFVPADGLHGTINEAERIYLASLITHAEGLGKIPVLSATRSLGRLRGIKKAFPGLHILIYRNLFQQWCSYTEQCFLNNTYFFDSIRETVEANQHDSFFRYLRDLFPLDCATVDSANHFYCFVLLHLYLYAHTADAADLIVDVNSLNGNADYRQGIERQIAQASGVEIDLSDARNAIAFSFVALGKPEELVGRLKAVADLAIAQAPSPQGQAFASKALTELVEEYSQYHFYAGQLTTTAGTGGLIGERDRLSIERDSLRAERDHLAAERDELRMGRDRLATERDDLVGERDRLSIACDSLHAERDRLAAERDDLVGERDRLAAERDELRMERDRLAAEGAAVLGSTSWRVTAPIRAVRNLFRRRSARDLRKFSR